jgi:hypothetical protein
MAFPIVPLALLAAAAYGASKLLTKGPGQKLDPTPVNPTAQGAIQGKTYSLLFLDASGNLDGTATAAKMLQAGWAPVQGLPQVQRTGLPTPSGGNATEWLSVAVRVGPTTLSPNMGLEGFAILENAQVAA